MTRAFARAPHALVVVSLIGAIAVCVVACSKGAARLTSEPEPVAYVAPAPRAVVRREVPPPPMACRSDWCRANCTTTNPNLPSQCRGFALEGSYAPQPDIQGNPPPAPVSSSGEICRAAGKC